MNWRFANDPIGGTTSQTITIFKGRSCGMTMGILDDALDWINWPRYPVDPVDPVDVQWEFTVRELRSALDGTIKAVRRLTAAMKKASGCALPMPRFGEDRPSAPFERTSYARARFSKRSLGDNRYRVMLS